MTESAQWGRFIEICCWDITQPFDLFECADKSNNAKQNYPEKTRKTMINKTKKKKEKMEIARKQKNQEERKKEKKRKKQENNIYLYIFLQQ